MAGNRGSRIISLNQLAQVACINAVQFCGFSLFWFADFENITENVLFLLYMAGNKGSRIISPGEAAKKVMFLVAGPIRGGWG